MLIFRWLVLFLLLGAALSLAFYLGTGRARYKRWALLILKWSVIAGVTFFAVLMLGRIL
ncbi:hypothetical protein ACFO3A_11490 [Comamonas nitrativorans]|uniref:Transmembrane protein n=1 Tax=Comamonas nitrativorans TaxID=108437 RepID=A0ABV9H017_9BURK